VVCLQQQQQQQQCNIKSSQASFLQHGPSRLAAAEQLLHVTQCWQQLETGSEVDLSKGCLFSVDAS
jgi:hypothetical protein